MTRVRSRRWVLGLAGLLAVLQFIRPERANPGFAPEQTLAGRATVPPEVQAIFVRACQDCHSYQTRWPWYSHVAPASWLVARHVQHGREHLNFSDWALTEDPRELDIHLREICEEVQSRSMPLRSYLLLHPHARLSPEEIRTICSWTDVERNGHETQRAVERSSSRVILPRGRQNAAGGR